LKKTTSSAEMRESDARTLAALRKWSVLLDSAFRVPGTNMTFGLDPLLGLIPVLGDLTTPLFAGLLLLHAVRLRIPRVVQVRMLMNAAIDFIIGIVPVVGDLFDFGWKANVRNLALLERHARPGSSATGGDWAFVVLILGGLFVIAVTPFLVLGWVLAHLRLY
jgi:Domain of unknown function (DUF4112)